MLRGCRACRAHRATSPSSLPRAYLIGRPAVCCGVYSAARLSVCRVVLQIPRARHARLLSSVLGHQLSQRRGCRGIFGREFNPHLPGSAEFTHNQQEAFEKCWAHSPLRPAARRIAIYQVSLLSHAATVARRLRIDIHNNDDDDNNDNA